MNTELTAFFERTRPAVDASLDELLPSESTPPSEIHRAMRYSIFAGGKRLRPTLCMAGYAVYHDDCKPILPVASAIEMVHTYSLIHDDLPAMDDDDYRRGVPSCHKRFGEATAILAGDALLTLAFEVVGRCRNFPPDRMAQAISRLAQALGTRDGMIAGQVLDLQAEGQPIKTVEIEAIHRAKTAALISTAVWMGSFLGGGHDADLARISAYGESIGLAYQIIDDILDETESRQTLGKTAGKDRQKQKATYPALYGLQQSRKIAQQLTGEARHALRDLGPGADLLIDISEYLAGRCS